MRNNHARLTPMLNITTVSIAVMYKTNAFIFNIQ